MIKKLMLIFFTTLCLCTACGEASVQRTPTISEDKIDWDKYYTYKDIYTLSQKRIEEGEVIYIEDADSLVDDAIKECRIQMSRERERHLSGKKEYNTEEDYKAYDKFLNRRGYYISLIPVTRYDNNLNMLWDCFVLYIFGEDAEPIGYAYVSELNGRLEIRIELMREEQLIYAARSKPDSEFIMIQSTRGGSIYREQKLLGEDNYIYENNQYIESGITSAINYKCDGDVFHALPEEMRFSYNELCDKENLRWIEFEKVE